MKDVAGPTEDIRMLKAAAGKHGATGAFMSAASPGVTGYFFRNEYYPSQEAYLFALAEALRHEYEAIVNAGIMLQIDCPDLVAQRIGRYANLAGRDNVMAGTDCGFSIHVGSGGVDPDVVWAKLTSLAEGARIATKRFWPGR